MNWFDQIKRCLPGYYRADGPAEVVGYLKGSANPAIWRQMEAAPQQRNQMLILGNTEPTNAEWAAAGVAQRGNLTTVQFVMLSGFIVLYAGFMLRPWGRIHTISQDALTVGFPASLRSWQINYRPPRRP